MVVGQPAAGDQARGSSMDKESPRSAVLGIQQRERPQGGKTGFPYGTRACA